ncbi:MAG TPA: ATP-binding cassette domain-containing protein [Prolixibacteraceae bacterium]|nr:ATP-binding cassette domain-containing protein [Prolixibacteraceae bacterium]
MNETTLNALINLFALFSALSESTKEDAVKKFSQYLNLHLGISASDEYLKLFEELLELYGVDGVPAFELDMNQQVHKISTHIKGRLQKDEQIMVFLRFLELAKSGNTEKAKNLIQTLSQVFEINQKELEKFIAFIFFTSTDHLSSPDFLLIDANENSPNPKVKHIREKNLDGELLFMYSSLIGNFIFILKGKEDLILEGNPILPERFYAFKEGSIIRGPRISPVYYTDIATYFADKKTVAPFVFSGEELEFKFPNSDNGLHRFSFSEHSGQLIAIMGGSGVGKSTLLNILNGNIPVQHGSIKINQFDIHVKQKEIEGLIGFVPQDDLLFEDLTVWENLYYNARLCFEGISEKEIEEKVSQILHELELYPYKDLKVGSPLKKFISGGQRKRLNVALELIREPSILFVDEPTSGLSSTDSEKVMLLLKQQARKGKLIMVNIHQPSSVIFKLFDQLWIMDKGGRPIYTGNPLDAIIYFKKEVNHINADVCVCGNCGNVNPEQVLEIVETKMIDSSGNFTNKRRFTPEFWYSLFRERTARNKERKVSGNQPLPSSGFKKPGLLKQFRIFFNRNLRIKVTDRQYMLINLIEAPLLALIVGYFTRFAEGNQYIFFDNKSLISYLFMAIVVVLFMGMSVSAEEIIKDRKILQRESFLNLSRFSYLNSKILFLVLLSAFQAFSFVLIGNLILEIHHMTWIYWLVLFSVAVFSNMLGLNISSAFDSVVTVYILIPLLLIPQILLCGVIVKFDDLQRKTDDRDAVPFVGDIMVSRWAFEALAVEQFKDNSYMCRFFDMEKEMAQARYCADLLTTELTGQIDLVNGWIDKPEHQKEVVKKLNIIRNEMGELDREGDPGQFASTDQLVPGKFNDQIARLAKEHLARLKESQNKRYQQNKRAKDQLINQINKEKGGSFLYDQKMKYHNNSLETLVLNSETKEYYRETPNGYMQKIAPIYKTPDFKNGRAHFLASQKGIGEIQVDTFTFNVLVIWAMSLLLYVALYFDWLRRLIAFFGKLRFKKRIH